MLDRDWMGAYVAGHEGTTAARISVEDGVLMVDGWWPAVVRLEPATFLVRVDDAPPDPDLAPALTAFLEGAGFHRLDGEFPLIEAVTLQRLGLLGVPWQVWAKEQADAEEAIAMAATGESASATSQEAEDVVRRAEKVWREGR